MKQTPRQRAHQAQTIIERRTGWTLWTERGVTGSNHHRCMIKLGQGSGEQLPFGDWQTGWRSLAIWLEGWIEGHENTTAKQIERITPKG